MEPGHEPFYSKRKVRSQRKLEAQCFFFRATTYFINRKSSYMSKQTWKLKDKDRPGENSCPEHFANRNLKDGKIQNHP
jgi:hypothetical protein